jgi:hypothetical protein
VSRVSVSVLYSLPDCQSLIGGILIQILYFPPVDGVFTNKVLWCCLILAFGTALLSMIF